MRYYCFTHECHKLQSYLVWFLRYGAQQTKFFVMLDHFLPFHPLTTQKTKFLKNEKNTWRYGEQRTEFFVILDHFCPFNSLTIQKIKILKKMKKIPGDITVLHKCTKNYDHMLYCSWDMAYVIYNLFWDIFCPFIPLPLPP